MGHLAYGYYLQRDLDTAQKHLITGFNIQKELGIQTFMSMFHLYLSYIKYASDKLIKARKYVGTALALSQKAGEKGMGGLSLLHLGRLLGKKNP